MTSAVNTKTRFVETLLGKVAVFETGKGSPIILLHPNAHDHKDFDLIVPALAEKHRVIAIDWPGHGDSSLNADPQTVTVIQIADVLPQIIADLKLRQILFIGNSIGGFAAVRYALRNPENIRGLILVNSGGFNSGDFKAKIFCNIMGSEWVVATIWNLFPQVYLRIKNPHVRSILERNRARKNPAALQLFTALWKSFLLPEHDLRKMAKNLKAPTLLIWGRHDPVVPVAAGRLAAETISGSRFRVIDSGHEPFAEAPEDFLAVVMPFIDALK